MDTPNNYCPAFQSPPEPCPLSPQECAQQHVHHAVHYIGMVGLHGCLPTTCDVYDTYDDAVDALATIHELGAKRRAVLKRHGYIELNPRRDGNEYAEITECDCADPSVHSDSE